jgi:hypothetical protein
MHFGEGEDGYLGMDFLKRYNVDFDPDARVVRISRHLRDKNIGNQVQLPLLYDDLACPVVIGRLGDSAKLRVMIDSGSSGVLKLSPDDEKLAFPNGLGRSLPGHILTVHGESNCLTTRMPYFALGEFISTDVLCDVQNAASTRTLAGFGFLSRYRVILDFPNDTLTLARCKRPVVNDADMSGIHFLRNGQKKSIIAYIDDDSPASRAGLQAADELLAIDGRPASELRSAVIRRMLRSGDGNVVRLRVTGGKSERTVESSRRK